MTLKEEREYFEADISPYEQYKEMLKQEKTQLLNEKAKGFARYEPFSYYASSGQRTRLVQNIFAVGHKLEQSPLTLHLAVRLLDRVFSLMGDNSIALDSYDLITYGCMLLAAKFEELDMKIPMIQDLMAASKFKLTYPQLKGVQSELITLLDFDLMALTPYHFLAQLFASGLVMSCDMKQSDKDISERTLVKVREYSQFFLDVATEQYSIMNRHPPSVVANACYYYARRCCQLHDHWNEDIMEYTGYSKEALAEILAEMEAIPQIGSIAKYAISNFSDTKRSWEGKKDSKATREALRERRVNQIFDSFLLSRAISDPYQECALPKGAPRPKLSPQVEALTLHACPFEG